MKVNRAIMNCVQVRRVSIVDLSDIFADTTNSIVIEIVND